MPTPNNASGLPLHGRKWIKSSRSAGNGCCLEVALPEASESDETQSLEQGDLVVLIRDSKFPRSDADAGPEPIIAVDRQSWSTFLDRVAAGSAEQIDGTALVANTRADGGVDLSSVADRTELAFTKAEWIAFVEGVKDGELR